MVVTKEPIQVTPVDGFCLSRYALRVRRKNINFVDQLGVIRKLTSMNATSTNEGGPYQSKRVAGDEMRLEPEGADCQRLQWSPAEDPLCGRNVHPEVQVSFGVSVV